MDLLLYDAFENYNFDSKDEIRNILYKGTTSMIEFNYDRLYTPYPLSYLFSEDDCYHLYKIATSIKYAGNKHKKLQEISNIMKPKGFIKLAGGTNRVVYYHPDIPNTVWKVATDDTGMGDNPAEFYNQQFIRPHCTKVFEVHPSGIIASFERVQRIINFAEFEDIADSVYNIIYYKLIGKYVLEDFGIDYFMNWGVRTGFGPVILDFPYVYELDGDKLYCNTILDNGEVCDGVVDYDAGFNILQCEKCGRIYRARDLAKTVKGRRELIRKGKGKNMKISIMRGDTVVRTSYQKDTVEYMRKPAKAKNWKNRVKTNNPIENHMLISKTPQISLVRGNTVVSQSPDTETVYSSPENKNMIVASVQKPNAQEQKKEIVNDSSNSVKENRPKRPAVDPGYERIIKNGRIVSMRKKDGKEDNKPVSNSDDDVTIGTFRPVTIIAGTDTVRQAPVVAKNEDSIKDKNVEELDNVVSTTSDEEIKEEDTSSDNGNMDVDSTETDTIGNYSVQFNSDEHEQSSKDDVDENDQNDDYVEEDDNVHIPEKSMEDIVENIVSELDMYQQQDNNYSDDDNLQQEQNVQNEEKPRNIEPTPTLRKGGKVSLSEMIGEDVLKNY